MQQLMVTRIILVTGNFLSAIPETWRSMMMFEFSISAITPIIALFGLAGLLVFCHENTTAKLETSPQFTTNSRALIVSQTVHYPTTRMADGQEPANSPAATTVQPAAQAADPESIPSSIAVAPVLRRQWKKENLLEKCMLLFRALCCLFSFISFIVMASNKHDVPWQNFDKYQAYKLRFISVLIRSYVVVRNLDNDMITDHTLTIFAEGISWL